MDKFQVYTYEVIEDLKSRSNYVHWSDNLKMHIEKNGIKITLNSNEIEQLVKSLPRTVGGTY